MRQLMTVRLVHKPVFYILTLIVIRLLWNYKKGSDLYSQKRNLTIIANKQYIKKLPFLSLSLCSASLRLFVCLAVCLIAHVSRAGYLCPSSCVSAYMPLCHFCFSISQSLFLSLSVLKLKSHHDGNMANKRLIQNSKPLHPKNFKFCVQALSIN